MFILGYQKQIKSRSYSILSDMFGFKCRLDNCVGGLTLQRSGKLHSVFSESATDLSIGDKFTFLSEHIRTGDPIAVFLYDTKDKIAPGNSYIHSKFDGR